tara:strand:+ start:1095 stop:1364 length:270 start_codon:yes stop_codon:yes gene_type:complete
MRHGFRTMDEIRDGMSHMLDGKTMMHLTGYGSWTYTVAVAQELVDTIDDTDYCKETLLWAFDYACGGTWEFVVAALNILIDAWLNDEEE